MLVVVVALLAAGYETAALASRGRLPTITAAMRRLPWWSRLAIVGAFSVGLADHFVTGWLP